jgi:hypothetical protein
VVRSEPLGDDLALPALALFVSSALLGSHVCSRFQQRVGGSRSNEDPPSRPGGP